MTLAHDPTKAITNDPDWPVLRKALAQRIRVDALEEAWAIVDRLAPELPEVADAIRALIVKSAP